MDDLISRQVLLAEQFASLECILQANKDAGFDVYKRGWNDALQTVHDNAPSAQQWIPCNERMPEAEEKVWIQTSRGKVCFAMYEDGTVLESESTWTWYDIDWARWDDEEDCGVIPEGWWEFTQFHPDCEFDCPVDEKVVAWMKLPELYKEDDNDKV